MRPLLAIFQRSLFQGCLPKEWKRAKVIPLNKGKGDKSAASSYRPISLTCVACKILERLIVKSLTSYLDIKGLLDPGQHGFRHGKSTVTNLLRCDTHIVHYLNGGRACDLISIDFRRAFDQVDHGILCAKLKSIGVDGCYLDWI